MDVFSILETFGLPVAMVIALGFYISKKDKQTAKEQKWIREELSRENRESFERNEGIIIKLIDQQKIMQQMIVEIRTRQRTMIEVIAMMMDSKTDSDAFEKKFVYKKREDL